MTQLDNGMRTEPCGCRYDVLAGRVTEKCATHRIGPMACCPKARTIPCVCMYSYTCPEHGNQHIGSHD